MREQKRYMKKIRKYLRDTVKFMKGLRNLNQNEIMNRRLQQLQRGLE